MEMFRKVQEHDRELKRMKDKSGELVSRDDIDMVNQKLNYMMNDDYVASNNAPLKAEMKGDIKKTVEMVVQLDLNMQMNYVSKEEMQAMMAEIEGKLNERVTAGEFSEAL